MKSFALAALAALTFNGAGWSGCGVEGEGGQCGQRR
jgi:hypothetical protein